MMKVLICLGILTLAGCGVDGAPERPLAQQGTLSEEKTRPLYGQSRNYTDERGVIRTPGKSTAVGTTVTGPSAEVVEAGGSDSDSENAEEGPDSDSSGTSIVGSVSGPSGGGAAGSLGASAGGQVVDDKSLGPSDD